MVRTFTQPEQGAGFSPEQAHRLHAHDDALILLLVDLPPWCNKAGRISLY